MTTEPIIFTPLLEVYICVTVFVLGACIGSFLNVCIYRIPLEQSVVRPRSHCPACNQMIAWYDNLPMLSYVLLNGRCRHCGVRISSRYFLVELLTGALFLLVWLKYPFSPVAPALWLFFSALILGTFVDFDHFIIPDRVSIGGMIAGPLVSMLAPALHGTDSVMVALLRSLAGLALGFGLLWLTGFIGRLAFRKEAMGFGDVKLLGAIGAFTGWQGVLFTLFLSSLTGSLVGITLVILGLKSMQSRIPFGPYLALGAVLWSLAGTNIWNFYTTVLTTHAIR